MIRAAAICLAVALSACSSLPPNPERQVTMADLDTAQTRLGRVAAPLLAAQPGLSGFLPINEGSEAFVARVELARAAERTLDLQYYSFHADQTGIALLGELLAAADRGVRVRLLLDDVNTSGQDAALAAIDSHPLLELRLFNPFANRGARWLDGLTDFARVNRRMHNKAMTADSQVAIVGGRNIGDEYFAARTDLGFGDFDVVALGPVVREVSATFDDYWNSPQAYPAAALLARPEEGELHGLRGRVEAHMQALRGTSYVRGLEESELLRSIADKKVELYWGRSSVIADAPAKVSLPPEDDSTHAIPKLAKVLEAARSELLLISPYFVPGEWGTRWLADAVKRGVKVKILTNSFAATDVSAVHAGYAAYRKRLLQAGVELYELKPTADLSRAGKRRLTGSSSSRSSLHAKTYMADQQTLFVGSLNLDPRSARLNTEMGVVIDSAALCTMLRTRLLGRIPEAAWRVELDRGTDRLVWITRDGGREVREESEPSMGAWQSFLQGLLRMLPIEEQL
jgi:putative cardiolipin synthase